MAEKKLNIYEKLAKIREMTEVMEKDSQGYGYSYVSLPMILANVTAGMKTYGVSLVSEMCEDVKMEPRVFTKRKAAKNGQIFEEIVNEYVVSGHMVFTWVDNENPESKIRIPWYITGSQSDPSQAFGSGFSYAERYFLMGFFTIAALGNEDPDAWRSRQKEAEQMENAEIASQIISQVNEIITTYLSKYSAEEKKEKRSGVIDVIKNCTKGFGKSMSNPNDVKDPIVAAKLLEDIQSFISLSNSVSTEE